MTEKYDKALTEINRLTKKNNKDSLAFLARAIVNFKKGNKKKCFEILSGIEKNKVSFVSQIALAMQKEGIRHKGTKAQSNGDENEN